MMESDGLMGTRFPMGVESIIQLDSSDGCTTL